MRPQWSVDGGEYVDAVRAHAAALPEGAWVVGGGWSMEAFPGGVPTSVPLDRACPGRPVYLPNRDHHSAWVSAAALRLAGVDASTPDPPDGRVERDADGHPTGALHEGAMSLVADHVPAPTPPELLAGLQEGQRHLHALGIVGWQDALVGDGLGMHDTLATYVLAQERGLLTARTVLALWWDRARGSAARGPACEKGSRCCSRSAREQREDHARRRVRDPHRLGARAVP